MVRKRIGPILLLSSLGIACTAGGVPSRTDAGPGGRDAAPDAGERRACTTSAECDDGHECTLDSCVAGNVCEHAALSERCDTGEICSLARGCIAGCSTDADCDDGNFCNGVERCAAERCLPGLERDCDDGNECTVDTCDAALASCVYETAEGCDGGTTTRRDGGIGPMPFDPSRDYSGSFLLAPTQNSTCGAATYVIASVDFAIGGGQLRISADRFVLTQSPAPTGAGFDVTVTDGSCAIYRLRGTFSDSNNFSGMWTAMFGGGGCSICPNQSASVIGARR
jgi:hypothetical protein